MGKNYRETLKKQLRDPQFKKEWELLEPEFQVIRAMIDVRKEKNISQKQLSDLTGIAQSDISKLENGNANPSLRTLQRLASGLGMNVKVEFVPITPSSPTIREKSF